MTTLVGDVPNQALLKAAAMAASVDPDGVPSRNTTDCPAAMLVTPRKTTADANALESSSIFQPEMLTAVVPVFVSSNQSAAYDALLPFAFTSEMMTCACAYTVRGV